jgi:hypothetical protein
LLPDVTTDDLRSHLQFRDLKLHDYQVINHIDSANTGDAILEGLTRLSSDPKSPLDELAEQIEIQLQSVRPDLLDHAISLTKAEVGKLPRDINSIRTLAFALLQSTLNDSIKTLEYLAARINTPESVDRILDIIAPVWVDLSAARWITFCTTSEPKPAAVINASSKFAAEMYVRRACCKPPKTMWRFICVTGTYGEYVFEDLVEEVLEALLTEFSTILNADPFDNNPEIQLSAVLHELNRQGRSVIIVLRLMFGAADLMPQLQNRFPYLTFLFLSGEELPDEEQCPETVLRRVEPALSPGQETTARTDYQTARTILRAGV